MERRGLAGFWVGAILFGSVLLRDTGEFHSAESEAANTEMTRVDMCDTLNT